MSGGHFNYNQYFINDIADEIEELIRESQRLKKKTSKKEEVEWQFYRGYPKDVIKEFKKAVKVLRKAYVYAHRIDWFLSGDDSEKTFHERLKEDLKKC